jgi:nicotinic acid mononucleotide adenylyltransferase
MKRVISVLICHIFLGVSFSQAAVLTEEVIRRAQTIAIMPGTFDPITTGHIAVAEVPVQMGLADLTILVPLENPKKHPISRADRMGLLEIGTVDKPELYVASQGSLRDFFIKKSLFETMNRVRSMNPNAKIVIVVGSDVTENIFSSLFFEAAIRPSEWIVIQRKGSPREKRSPLELFVPHRFVDVDLPATSSSAVRAAFKSHSEYYSALSAAPKISGLLPSVAERILQRHFYQNPDVIIGPSLCSKIFERSQP